MAKKTENEVKETKKEAAVMDEAAKEKFQQKLKDLLALAKKKKNMLEYQEISDHFADLHLEEEQMDEILDALEKAKSRLKANVNFELTMELLLLTIKEN